MNKTIILIKNKQTNQTTNLKNKMCHVENRVQSQVCCLRGRCLNTMPVGPLKKGEPNWQGLRPGFLTRMVYLYNDIMLRHTILVRNSWCVSVPVWIGSVCFICYGSCTYLLLSCSMDSIIIFGVKSSFSPGFFLLLLLCSKQNLWGSPLFCEIGACVIFFVCLGFFFIQPLR